MVLVEPAGDELREDRADLDLVVFAPVHGGSPFVSSEPELGFETDVGGGDVGVLRFSAVHEGTEISKLDVGKRKVGSRKR